MQNLEIGFKYQQFVEQMLTIDGAADAVHGLARANGWHPEGETEDYFIERLCNNLHNEVSELHESYREGKHRGLCDKAAKMQALDLPPLTCLEEELADIIIRALDNARRLEIDISRAIIIKHLFNKTRPFRHGGKKS